MSDIYLADGWSASSLYFRDLRHHPRLANVFFARFVPEQDIHAEDVSVKTRIDRLFNEYDNLDARGKAASAIRGLPEKKVHYFDDPDTAIYSRLFRVSGHSAQMNVHKFNQYNRIKNVTLGIDTGAVTCDWRDTADSAGMNLWKLYYAFFFKQSRVPGPNRDQPEFSDDTAGRSLFQEYGIDLRHKKTRENFFRRMEIYYMCAGAFTRIDLINPTISHFKYSDLSLDESSLAVHSMTLEYERIVHVHNELPIRTNRAPREGDDHGADIHSNLKSILGAEDAYVRGPLYTGPFTSEQLARAALVLRSLDAPLPDAANNRRPPETTDNSTPLNPNIAGFASLPSGNLDVNNWRPGLLPGKPGDPEYEDEFRRQMEAFKPDPDYSGFVHVRDSIGKYHTWVVNKGKTEDYLVGSLPPKDFYATVGGGFAGINQTEPEPVTADAIRNSTTYAAPHRDAAIEPSDGPEGGMTSPGGFSGSTANNPVEEENEEESEASTTYTPLNEEFGGTPVVETDENPDGFSGRTDGTNPNVQPVRNENEPDSSAHAEPEEGEDPRDNPKAEPDPEPSETYTPFRFEGPEGPVPEGAEDLVG